MERTFSLGLALLAVVWGQLFGFHSGCLTEIDGRIVQIMASHHQAGDTLDCYFEGFMPLNCNFAGHTPHSHDHDDPSHQQDHEEFFHGPVSTQSGNMRHVPMVDQPDLTQLQRYTSIPPLVLLPLCHLFGSMVAAHRWSSASPTVPPLVEPNRSPPAALLVAQCMVMLV